MADDLTFDMAVTGNRDVVQSVESIGKASADSALKIEAANLRVEKSARAVAQAEEKYGKGSLEARSAALSLAQANVKLDKSMQATEHATESAAEGLDGFKVAAAGIATVAAAGLGVAVSKALDIQAANAKLTGQLALTGPEAQRYGKIAGDLYAGAYGDSLDQVNEALRNVTQNIGQLGDEGADSLQNVTAKVIDLATAFDTDLFETTRAVGALMRNGLAKDATQALDLITFGLQKIPGAQEDLLDTLSEYAVQFKAVGLNGEQALSFIQAAMLGGARNTDIAADAVKEFNLRARDITNTGAQKALADLGLDAEATARKVAGGGDSAAAAMADILTKLRDVEDPATRSALAVALLGTQAEDMQDALFAVDPKQFIAGLEGVKGSADGLDSALGDTQQARIESYKRSLEQTVAGWAAMPGPAGAATAAVVAFGGSVISTGAELALLAPAAKGLPGALKAVGSGFANAAGGVASFVGSAGKARSAIPILTKASLAILGYVAAMEALGAVAPKVEDSAVGVGELSLALSKLGDTDAKSIAGLGKNFEDLGAQLEGLANPNAAQRVDDFTGSLFNLVSFGAVGSSKGGDARRLFLADLETLDSSLTNLVQSGKTDQAADLFQTLNDKAVAGGAGVDQLARHLPNYTDAVAAAAAESGGAVVPVESLARGLDKQGKAAGLTADELAKLAGETTAYTNAALDGRSAARDFEAAIDEASAAVKGNGKTLDITTEAGRANADALDSIASSGVALANQMVSNGGSEAQFQGQLSRTRAELIKAGTRMGLTRAAAKAYAEQVLRIPARAATSVSLSGVGAANAAILAFRRNIGRIPGHKTVFVDVRGGNSPARGPSFASASGGPIRGPGTGTSDSILGYLSNGEHVWTAAEVNAAGGHAAVEALRKAALRHAPLDTGQRTGGGWAPALAPQSGPAMVVLEVVSGGTKFDDALVEVLRRAVKAKGGGNVQVALGRAS